MSPDELAERIRAAHRAAMTADGFRDDLRAGFYKTPG